MIRMAWVGARGRRCVKGREGGDVMGAQRMAYNNLSVRVALFVFALASVSAAGRDLRLIDAAKQNDQVAVRTLLEQGVDVNARHPDGSTALLWAVYYDDIETAGLLVSAGADVNAANDYGESPLSLACQNRNVTLVDKLLKAGANPHAVKPSGETVLMTAARAGNLDIVSLLLAQHPDVNARESSKGQTALMLAVANKHSAVVEALIAANADVNAASTGGSTPLHFAVQQGDVRTAKRLLAAGADVHATMTVRQIDNQFVSGVVDTLDGLTPLWLAIQTCRQDGPEFSGAARSVGTKRHSGRLEPHPLSLSCPVHEELGALFLDHGADPNQPDGSRIPPLHRAAQTGMKNLVAALLSHGADPNARVPADASQIPRKIGPNARAINPLPIGATPFFVAAWTHHPEVMQVLLAANADPHMTADDKTTPLMAAAGVSGRPPMGYTDILDTPKMLEAVQVALNEGADINAVNDPGQTAMHGAAKMSGWRLVASDVRARASTELIQLLADNGAKVDVEDNEGETPLSLADAPAEYGGGGADEAGEGKSAAELLTELTAR